MDSETQAVSPGCAGGRGQSSAAVGGLAAAGKVMCLPRTELEHSCDQYDHGNRKGNGARQRRQLHLNHRERGAQWKRNHSEQGPNGKITDTHQQGQPGQPLPA
jgi:hypothetical protein